MLALLPRLIFSLQACPVRILSDEVATMSGGAFFAGLDWSRVISHAGYYGVGFSLFTAPFFVLTDNPFIIYRGISVTCAVLQAATAPVCFHLMETYFDVKDVKLKYLLSFSASFMVATRATVIYNEHIMIFLTWVLVWILLKLHSCVEDRLQVRIQTILLAAVLAYSLTVHTRALIYWLAVLSVVAGYLILYKKWLVSRLSAVPAALIGILLSKNFVSYMQNALWASGGEPLRNSQISVSFQQNWSNPVTWKAWTSIVLGQLNTITMFSGGWMMLVFIVLVSLIAWKLYVRFRLYNIEADSIEEKRDGGILICGVFAIVACALTIAGQSLMWLNGVAEAFRGGFNSEAYALKAITYIRYFAPYIGPLFMAGVLYLYGNQRWRDRVLAAYVISAGILQIFWLTMILPYMYQNYDASEAYRVWGLWNYHTAGSVVSLRTYLAGSLMLFISSVILMVCWRYGKTRQALGALALIMLFTYCYSAWHLDIVHAEAIGYSKGNKGYELMQELEARYDPDDTVYVVDGVPGRLDNYNFYMYQFVLSRYTVIPDMPKEDTELLVFCNKSRYEPLFELGYESYTLDRNEYVYVKDGKYRDWLEELGVVSKENRNEPE